MKNLITFLFFTFLITGSMIAQNRAYQIQKDENLDSLAKKFKVNKEAILKLNPDLKKDDLANQVIIIPTSETDKDTPKASSIQFKEYRVKHKETLYSLAKENNISVDDIKKYNPYLYDNELGENDMIRIPIFQEEPKDFNASVQTSTFKNLIHVVMPKETRYGISKRYEMSIEELDSLNPAIDTLHPGQVLRVINPLTKKEEEKKYEFYEVAPKETMYSLTRSLEISQDSLEKLNPILKELGLQAGMELRIPRDLGSVADLESGSSKFLNLSDLISNRSTKKMAVMLPFNLSAFDDEDADKEKLLKKDQLLQISLDLYSGIKAAIDSVQKMGISVDAEIFDTQAKPDKIDEILNQNDFEETSIIIGPLLPNNIGRLAKQLNHNKTAIFSPLTSEEIKGSEYIFQTRPSNEIKENVLMSYLDSLQNGKNLLVLADGKNSSFKNQLKERYSSIREITQKDENYLQRSDITNVLDKNRPNWIIMATEDHAAISNAISSMNAERKNYEIRILTPNKNSIYDDEVPSEFLSNLDFTYISVDKNDTANEHKSFIQHYLETYGITPSAYAIRGFDITLDALLRASTGDDIFDSLKDNEGITEYVENRFKYLQKKTNGYYNSAVYIIKFDKDLKLSILN